MMGGQSESRRVSIYTINDADGRCFRQEKFVNSLWRANVPKAMIADSYILTKVNESF